ncbi:MAG: hypothetical protein IPK60_24950 [Sandaracinaceae bacterium]|nr:hypothetical protein [Sandaracinaceae bacterium]
MLPPFIIDQIRRREEEERREDQRPVLELPVPVPDMRRPPEGRAKDEPERGVVVIDLMG